MPGDGGVYHHRPPSIEDSPPSPPPIPPSLEEGGVGEVYVSTYEKLLGLVWDLKLGMAMTGNFPFVPHYQGGCGYCPAASYQAHWRVLLPILNLSGLNTYLRLSKFHTGTLSSIIQGPNQGWWIMSLDLKDVCLHVPFAHKNVEGNLIAYQ